MKNFNFRSSNGSYRVKPIAAENGHVPAPIERKTDWRSVILCAVFTFTASVQFSLFFTSLWPFMQLLDASTTISFFGAVIAMYSLSQIVASPLLGIWSNRIERLKPPLLLCNIFLLIGNALYAMVELFPAAQTRYVLMASRLVAGIGWAQVGLLKSFAAAASVNKDRSRATAFATGGVALGTTLGPTFQTLFTWIQQPGYPICLNLFGHQWCLHVSMFTAPALFACVVDVVLIVVMVFWFRESYVGIMQRKADKVDSNGPKLPPYDRKAVAVCYAMRFTQFFIFTNLETIGTAYAMVMFLWTPTEVVFWESIAHSIRGALALSVYISYIICDLGKFVNDRLACFCSLVGLMVFHVVTYSWPFLPQKVHIYEGNGNSSLSGDHLGCDRQQLDWCDGLNQVNVWVYYTLMILLIGLGFPNINVTMNTLFSRIIGPRMQGKQQGMLEMFGGMGRMLGPLLIGFLYRSHGPRAIWLLEMAEIGMMMVFWLLCYSRLVPLRVPPELAKGKDLPRVSFTDSLAA